MTRARWQFDPLTKIEKAGLFGSDKYMLHGAPPPHRPCAGHRPLTNPWRVAIAEISPVALAAVAEEYQAWFAQKAQQVSQKQGALGAEMQIAETQASRLGQELQALSKEAATGSAVLNEDGAPTPPSPPAAVTSWPFMAKAVAAQCNR